MHRTFLRWFFPNLLPLEVNKRRSIYLYSLRARNVSPVEELKLLIVLPPISSYHNASDLEEEPVNAVKEKVKANA